MCDNQAGCSTARKGPAVVESSDNPDDPDVTSDIMVKLKMLSSSEVILSFDLKAK
jgi:hypothetical protein